MRIIVQPLLLFLCLLTAGAALGQKAKLQKATSYMEALEYEKAISVYLQILDKGDQLEAMKGLAKAYRKINDYPNAETWYAKLVQEKEIDPINHYYYGLILFRKGDCENAEAQFAEFLRQQPFDPRKSRLQHVCDYRETLLDKNKDVLEIADLSINSPEQEIGPAFYLDGLVFGSTRPPADSKNNKKHYFDLQYAPFAMQDGQPLDPFRFSEPKVFSEQLHFPYHEAMVAFSDDFSEIFLTRNNQVRKGPEDLGLIRLEIMFASNLGGDNWSDLNPLPFNSTEYSVAHPSLTPDGKRLFFSSDMPGGFGGKDLYVVFKDNGEWGKPINLGPSINTEGDEFYPHFDASGKLYFASDGHLGLGGQDIFFSEETPDGNWSEVENMGAPINSIYDDYGLILSKEGYYGYFTSNRAGGQGMDDVYGFRKKGVTVELEVLEAASGQSLPGAFVNACKQYPLLELGGGKFRMILPPGECCQVTAGGDGFMPQTDKICAEGYSAANFLRVQMALQPLERVAKWEVSGKVLNQFNGLPLANAKVVLTGGQCDEVLDLVTDADGIYKFNAQAGCCYLLRVEKKGYFAFASDDWICPDQTQANKVIMDVFLQPYNQQAQSTGSQPVASIENTPPVQPKKDPVPEKTPDPVPLAPKPAAPENSIQAFTQGDSRYDDDGSIPYLLNVYYEVGRSSVKKESVPELIRLFNVLEDNPDLSIEIASHTDARGSDKFNQNLSQRRAEAIVRYLIEKGISKSRLRAKGYGESRPVNDCVDGKDCPEDLYQMNRRTEFRVVDKS